jgi:putative multiple sugar transport system permease protein
VSATATTAPAEKTIGMRSRGKSARVIVAGHIDLSVGSVAGFTGALAAVLMVRLGMNFLLATLLCLLAGAAIGAAQGYWIAYFKIPSFIVTLAGMLVFRGPTLALLAGESIGPFPKEFQLLSSGFIPDYLGLSGFHLTSLIIGVLVAGAMFYTSLRTRINRQKHGFQSGPLWIFVLDTR